MVVIASWKFIKLKVEEKKRQFSVDSLFIIDKIAQTKFPLVEEGYGDW